MSLSVTHIAANEILIGGRRLRQRCAWCGAVLLDYDLTQLAAPVEPCSRRCDQGKILVPRQSSAIRAGDDEDCPHCHGTGNEPWTPGTYPTGRLVRVDGEGGFRSFVVLDETDELPDDACGKVDDEVTC